MDVDIALRGGERNIGVQVRPKRLRLAPRDRRGLVSEFSSDGLAEQSDEDALPWGLTLHDGKQRALKKRGKGGGGGGGRAGMGATPGRE